MGLRIISGHLKGRRLKGPASLLFRPTSDRVKESFFDILGSSVEGVHFLDLFAGSGNIGLEAVSLGAEHAVFIDSSAYAVKLIRRNIRSCGVENFCKVIHFDAFRIIPTLHNRDQRFHIVFMDPPYRSGIPQKILTLLGKYPILHPGGILAVEHDKHTTLMSCVGTLYREREVSYGDKMISFFSPVNEESAIIRGAME